jgi:hypothetical protein
VNIALAIIGTVSIVLVAHPRYEDGFFGRVALAGVVLAVTIILIGEWGGKLRYDYPLEISLLVWSVALFMLRHAGRFIYFWLTGKGAWPTRKETA